ncbi:MAG: M48 family metalloprotease [Armatimonadetes bacterium]|nr:MAG: hypothetical protein EDM73_12205 [Armatimonadota bacterium]MCE7900743.1 hypothetical protein [Armatimonadetes bacterium ATM1]MDL1928623.1 hypothetical protein [Fimbriimonadia bacterium ATM]MBC6970105.1 hypothetical protein [Armatimonadota bacterium]MBL1149674.1 hypothetical protein [Armatimonadota bacterium]
MTHCRTATALLSLGLALAALAGAGCRNANILSKEEEIRIGRDGATRIEETYPVSRNPADQSLVERIGQKIATVNNLDWPFTFKVLEDKQVNAISLPGGPVYVFRGLLNLSEGNEDEIALVIAHEIAHIERRHVAKMYTQGVLTDLVILLGTQGTAQTAAQVVQMFAEMRFSRDDEYESDRLGIQYAYKAGFDPNGLIRFFEKLKRLEGENKGDIVSNNLRTHPLTDARIKRAKEEIAKVVQAVNREQETAALLRALNNSNSR